MYNIIQKNIPKTFSDEHFLKYILYNSYLKGPSSLELSHLLVIPLPPMLKWHLTEDDIIPPRIA